MKALMSTTCRWQARDPRSKWSPWSIWKPKDQDSWRWYKFKDGANQRPHSNRPYKKFPPTQAFVPFRSSVGWISPRAEEGGLCCNSPAIHEFISSNNTLTDPHRKGFLPNIYASHAQPKHTHDYPRKRISEYMTEFMKGKNLMLLVLL